MTKVQIMACPGTGVKSVVKRLKELLNTEKLPLFVEAASEQLAGYERDGCSDCHAVSLALLADLHKARWKGWVLHQGTYRGDTAHSWLECGTVAVDGSTNDDGGVPVLLVMDRWNYRKVSGSQVVKSFTPADVASGRYGREYMGSTEDQGA